jgi:hypothetical protein
MFNIETIWNNQPELMVASSKFLIAMQKLHGVLISGQVKKRSGWSTRKVKKGRDLSLTVQQEKKR